MTAFEHEVAAVLAVLMLKERRYSAAALAPNVAAAIEAALPLGAGIPGWNDMRDGFKQAALAALRGTPT